MTQTDPRIEEWLQWRMFDLQNREFDRALPSIGPDKPLGAQGFSLRNEAERAGRQLSAPIVVHIDRAVGTWWVYAWHAPALTQLLQDNVVVLRRAGSPWKRIKGRPRKFVEAIRRRRVAPKTELYDLIADAYGDKSNPGRTDILPDVDPHLLLDRFVDTFGVADPVCLYFGRDPRTGRRRTVRG